MAQIFWRLHDTVCLNILWHSIPPDSNEAFSKVGMSAGCADKTPKYKRLPNLGPDYFSSSNDGEDLLRYLNTTYLLLAILRWTPLICESKRLLAGASHKSIDFQSKEVSHKSQVNTRTLARAARKRQWWRWGMGEEERWGEKVFNHPPHPSLPAPTPTWPAYIYPVAPASKTVQTPPRTISMRCKTNPRLDLDFIGFYRDFSYEVGGRWKRLILPSSIFEEQARYTQPSEIPFSQLFHHQSGTHCTVRC